MPSDSNVLLVALDGSEEGSRALPYAAVVAKAYGLTLELVHVVEDENADADRAKGWFEQFAAEAAAASGVTGFTTTILHGHPAATLLEHAEAARFVAIASHGLGGMKATFIGSVADKLVRGATTPVLFVPIAGASAPPQLKMILIAADGSDQASEGLAIGRELAAKAGAEVALVRAWRYPTQFGGEMAYVTPALLDAPKDEAEAYLVEIAKPGERTFTIEGYAPDAIGATADQLNADLVVVSTASKGVGKRLLLGSTTDRLMHSTLRPLLIVPHAK